MPFIEVIIDYKKREEQTSSRFFITEDVNYYSVADQARTCQIKIRKRDAYPGTFCYLDSHGTIIFGYGDNAKIDSEFLFATLDEYGCLTIERDAYATLPLFYAWIDQRLVLSNHYDFMVENGCATRLNIDHLVNLLIPNPDYHQTMYQDILILDERHTLHVESTGTRLEKPHSRSWSITKDALSTNPRDFSRRLSDRFDTFTDSRLTGQHFAFEVSGGIDSSTLPQYYKKRFVTEPTIIGSMIFPGSYKDTQLEKLHTVCSDDDQLIAVEIDEDADYPLARFMQKKEWRPFYSFEEIYTEPLQKLAKIMAERGVQVVSTGIGGDELFENITSLETEYQYGKTTTKNRLEREVLSFYTSKFREKWVAATPDQMLYPLPLLGVSLHGAQLARNNVYIDQGIWPVSPFSSPEIYTYCQGLPIEFRANKNILRAFHQSHRFSKEIYQPVLNENFAVFFNNCLLSDKYDQLVKNLADSSSTATMGYIDLDALRLAWENRRTIKDEHQQNQLLFAVFTWMSAELNIST